MAREFKAGIQGAQALPKLPGPMVIEGHYFRAWKGDVGNGLHVAAIHPTGANDNIGFAGVEPLQE